MLRNIINTLLFAIAFYATAEGIRNYTPDRLKIEWFKQHQSNYECVLIGSSHVYRQLDSEHISTEISSPGFEFDVFNFGVPGMRFGEVLYMANRLLDQDDGDLKVLVLELGDLRTDIEEDNLLTERTVYWHDFFASKWILKALLVENIPIKDKIKRLATHLHHFGHWLGNIGAGPLAYDKFATGQREPFHDKDGKLRPGIGENGHGWRPLDLEAGKKSYQMRRREFLADLPGFRNSRKNLMTLEWEGKFDPVLADAISELRAKADEKGVRLGLMVLAGYEKPSGWKDLHNSGVVDYWFEFNDPLKYPELYQAGYRWDLFHLNQKGSRILSQALANELNEMWSGGSH